MIERHFEFTLSSQAEVLEMYSPNDMDDIELKVFYSVWKNNKGETELLVNKVELEEVDIAPVLYAFGSMKFINALAENDHNFHREQELFNAINRFRNETI